MTRQIPITGADTEDPNEIIRREGIGSPKLKEVGRSHSGAGRGEGPHGEPNQGRHVPGGGQGEQGGPGRGGSETDPDAPDDAAPLSRRRD
jgi:hypothetical protein